MNTRTYLLRNKRLANVRRCEALRQGEAMRPATVRDCPYCGNPYNVERSTAHLTTRECLTAQRQLRKEN